MANYPGIIYEPIILGGVMTEITKRKIYGIKLPENPSSFLWIKDGKVYHERDPEFPFPYDSEIPKVIYTKERGPHREGEYIQPMLRHMIYLWNFANLETAKQYISDYSDYCEEIKQNENENVIVAYRLDKDGRIIAGATFLEAITDEIIDLDKFNYEYLY